MRISAKPAANDPATRYACDALDGKVVAGELVKAACRRHLKDLDGGSGRGLKFDAAKAKRHCGFFPAVLTVTEGAAAGKPFSLLPWHSFVVASLFGWQRSDGLRRFRMAWLETGKGQAKSPLMAGIGVDMMGYAGKERSEVYAIAGDKDQANVLFKDAVAMCRANLPGRDEDEFESLESRGDVVAYEGWISISRHNHLMKIDAPPFCLAHHIAIPIQPPTIPDEMRIALVDKRRLVRADDRKFDHRSIQC